ncbi:hypothetical protein [Corynebacterium sp. A21]|uniref:hypothetical protein n=1 Tax=Corynebacterium sp. A21 TaxID=3457318 RepID=UPI003FD6B5A6
MRNISKAALAVATTAALALGSTSIATAQDDLNVDAGLNIEADINADDTTDVPAEDIEITEGSSIPANGSSRLSDNLNGENEADARALFGSSKVNEETGATFDGQPAWAKLLYGLTLTGVVGSLLGLVFGPAYNFVVHGQGA